jgi:ubiquinol-cytochrome c reductase cytochrome c1 subunit
MLNDFCAHRYICSDVFLKDYVFSLLTGYIDPPAGVKILDGLNYNPYFPGGAIAMARVLFDGLVEYPDGECTATNGIVLI